MGRDGQAPISSGRQQGAGGVLGARGLPQLPMDLDGGLRVPVTLPVISPKQGFASMYVYVHQPQELTLPRADT